MPSLLQYSNGWGHLIMSIILLVVGLVLILVPTDTQTKALGVGIITTVAGTWLVTSTGNLVLRQALQNQQTPPAAPPAQPTQETAHA